MNRLAITRITKKGKSHIAYIMLNEKREFVDFQLSEAEGNSILNNIYICRVEDLVPNIHAAFVRISKEQKCFLSLEDIKDPIFTKKLSNRKELCIGDELLVQVTKDALKTKDPVVSSKLTLHGRCSVLTTENTNLSVSSKLPKDLKKQYIETLTEILNSLNIEHRNFGIIIRTSAKNFTQEEIKQDVLRLIDEYQSLCKVSLHRNVYSLMYQNKTFYIERLKSVDLTQIDQIITDQEDILEQIRQFYPATNSLLHLYQDKKIGLHTLYQIESNIDKLLSSRVWLKSGANIIIEQLETLTVIDVNTGKNQSKKAETLFCVNKEAAGEIALQLRLRNISGMILVDFINLKSKDKEEELIHYLKAELKKDNVSCNFIDITKLGIVEITRKKVYKSLKEIVDV